MGILFKILGSVYHEEESGIIFIQVEVIDHKLKDTDVGLDSLGIFSPAIKGVLQKVRVRFLKWLVFTIDYFLSYELSE